LHGYRPPDNEPDPRPLPSSDAATLALESTFETLSSLFLDTRLEADLPDLLWSFVNLFHRKAERIGRDLDDNETARRRSQAEQDGSEIRSVELERMIAQGLTLNERRNAFEFFRDHLAELYSTETGSSWRPRSGSQVNHRALTAAMIDSRDFLNVKKLPRRKCFCRPDLGSPLPAEPTVMIIVGFGTRSIRFARSTQTWSCFTAPARKARRESPRVGPTTMLEALPIGVIVFPGSGIVENLADKARKMGIPVWRIGKDGA
jgi:hypothetical protein